MKKAMIVVSTFLPLLAVSNPASAMDPDAQTRIEHCKLEAEKSGAENIADYVRDCLDDMMQYDTSSD